MSHAMPRILVVEDDPDISALIARTLERALFDVTVCHAGDAALTALTTQPPDLLVLDQMLPGVTGLEICRVVRATPTLARLPVIMVTARGDEAERITGLDAGADDYLPKPFSTGELLARVRALLRRATPPPEADPAASSTVVAYGPLVVNSEAHTVTLHGGSVTLTAKEFLFLWYLLQHRGRVLSRDTLLTDVWGYTYTGGTRTVDVHVRRLREKLPLLEAALITVKQFGYKLLPTPPATPLD